MPPSWNLHIGRTPAAYCGRSPVRLTIVDRRTPALREINGRLTFLENVGVNYLSLDRAADTLSGGELQRVRLATGIGSGLVGGRQDTLMFYGYKTEVAPLYAGQDLPRAFSWTG